MSDIDMQGSQPLESMQQEDNLKSEVKNERRNSGDNLDSAPADAQNEVRQIIDSDNRGTTKNEGAANSDDEMIPVNNDSAPPSN
jgi:hypothetical protein